MDQWEVAVIGAGPAGSTAARFASKAGSRTILIEEHSSVGWPVECAGLLGQKAIAESGLAGGSFAIQPMFGATVYSPGGQHLAFKARSCKAWVVDRRLFDRALAVDAVRSGVEILLHSSVKSIRRERGMSTLALASGREIRARIVISAEGVRARLSREAGIDPPRKVLSGAQVEAPFALEHKEMAEVHLGEAPGLFAWVIPSGEGMARIGLCAEDRGYERLQAFLRKEAIRKRLLGSPVCLCVGGLPLGPPRTTVADGFLAVGDAAGQVKPTSGGGVFTGLVAARIAGRVAAAAAQDKDGSAKRLEEYDRLWRAEIGRELDIGMKANRMLKRMSAEELDELVGYLASRPKLLETIEEHGDIDRPSLLFARMLVNLDWDAIRLGKMLRHILG